MESTNPKDKIGKTKPPLHLIPPSAQIIEAMAMQDGANKYGPYNWREKTVAATVYIAAVQRHLLAWLDGETAANDSGIHHLGHARASLGILLDAEAQGTMVDDRPSPGKAAELMEQFTKTTNPVRPQDKYDEYAQRLLRETRQMKNAAPQKRKRRVYISGPMRGIKDHNFPAFDRARDLAMSMGFDPISPADMDRADDGKLPETAEAETIRKYARRDVDALLSLRPEHGDAIALLPFWFDSVGAMAEVALARWLGLTPLWANTMEPYDRTDFADRMGTAIAEYIQQGVK
jgi:hypothetical protein